MIKLLIESIAIALESAFGEGVTIYWEDVEQDLKEPCFFIQCLEAGNNLFRGKRYYHTHQFCIQYFPASTDTPRAECEAAAEQLYSALEWLALHEEETLLGGKKMRHKTVDGVLHFFVNYDLFVMKQADYNFMGKLNHTMQEKKGEKTDGGKETHASRNN